MNQDILGARGFDTASAKLYYQDPWASSYESGLLFTALEEFGVSLNIHIGLNQKDKLIWYKVPHALHDGYSAYQSLFAELGLKLIWKPFSLPKKKITLKGIKLAFESLSQKPQEIKDQLANKTSSEFDFIYFKTSYKPSQWYLQKMHDFFREKTKNQSTRWMIPVRTDHKSGLQASYFAVEVFNHDTEASIKEKISLALNNGTHRVTKKLASFMIKLGKKVILKQTKLMLDQDFPSWTGSFSNLKNIGSSEAVRELILLAPVRWHRPVGVVIYEFNQEFYCTISLHSSVAACISKEDFKECLDAKA